MKKTIQLKESELNRLISESVKRVLNEGINGSTTIEERAKERADRHEMAEAQLHKGLTDSYGYSRIYNAEITSYIQGAKDQEQEIIDKACEWLTQNMVSKYPNISFNGSIWNDVNELLDDFKKV